MELPSEGVYRGLPQAAGHCLAGSFLGTAVWRTYIGFAYCFHMVSVSLGTELILRASFRHEAAPALFLSPRQGHQHLGAQRGKLREEHRHLPGPNGPDRDGGRRVETIW